MIGTPEERFARRQATAKLRGEVNHVLRSFGSVQPGTIALIDKVRKARGQSMDVALARMANFYIREHKL